MPIVKAFAIASALSVPTAAGAVVVVTTADSIAVTEIREPAPPREPVFTRDSGVRSVPRWVLASMPFSRAGVPSPASLSPLPVKASPPVPSTPTAAVARAPAQQLPTPAPAEKEAAATMGEVTTAPGDPLGDLSGAMASAVGDHRRAVLPTPKARSAASQLHPAAGATMAAFRSVLPSARKCAAAAGEGTSVRVVFQSDGSVARVDISDMCIRAALTAARVDPFEEESFATTVTVRRLE